MSKDELKKSIVRSILEFEKKNIHNGYPLTREEMISRIEELIIKEVDHYEDSKAKA
ncbi:hypothetical protein PQS34_15910 [Bacillus altitudinis]|uniref:hypothetical protein n=1 Tax=Bacillus altitudinis TaxID=293387 RepID=UPI001F4E1FEA|nr:hypothetical protein [Bacillus altitudinis]MDC7797569.1 hypothetical protein [Bacillus altitudinis]UNG01761.1 hypothetical protein MMZ59_03070 [Bacillus altitudinis]